MNPSGSLDHGLPASPPAAAVARGDWKLRDVALKFGIGDWTAFAVRLPLHTRSVRLAERVPPDPDPHPPAEPALGGAAGYMVRAMPVGDELPRIAVVDGFVRYVLLQYRHCYIDLSLGFDAYKQKFSAKTRSTISRKVRKFGEHCGGTLAWRSYRRADEMADFHRLAREVSARTYQERLLDAGIPDDAGFVASMTAAAADDAVRAYVLFDRERPVSYLYCPIDHGAVVYAYLGYDPDYLKHSVGTVLQWLALEELFAEKRFDVFDFTEGQSEHKRLFATHELRCANILFVQRTWPRLLLIRAHDAVQTLSSSAGALAERWGVKSRLRRALRFGWGRAG